MLSSENCKIFKNSFFYNTSGGCFQTKFSFINPFVPNVPFLYPLKSSANQIFSNVFWGIEMEHLLEEGNWIRPVSLNPFKLSVAFHIETSHLFLSAK